MATDVWIAPSGRSAPRRLMCLSAVIAVGAPIMVCSAAPASALTSCPGAEVVFARGTDEPPGIGRVGQAFVDSLRTRLSDEQVAVYAVDYPATRDFMKAVDGATDARARAEATAASCPNTQDCPRRLLTRCCGHRSDHRTRRRFVRFCPTAAGQRCQPCSRSHSFRQSIESVRPAPDGLEPCLRRQDYRPVQRR